MLIIVDNGLVRVFHSSPPQSRSSFPSMLRGTVTQSSGACYLEQYPVGCGLPKLSGGRLSLGALEEPMAENNGPDTPVAKNILWKEKKPWK